MPRGIPIAYQWELQLSEIQLRILSLRRNAFSAEKTRSCK